MDVNELERLYQGLLELIRSLGLGWVAEQVVEEVSVGKVLPADFKARRADMTARGSFLFASGSPDSELPRRGPREDVLVMEEYTPEDRLRLLLDAIEEAVVNTGSMEDQLFERLGLFEASSIQGIEFYSELTDEVTMTIDRSRARAMHLTGVTLKERLDHVRQEI